MSGWVCGDAFLSVLSSIDSISFRVNDVSGDVSILGVEERALVTTSDTHTIVPRLSCTRSVLTIGDNSLSQICFERHARHRVMNVSNFQ